VCEGAVSCLVSVSELMREVHQVNFTPAGVVINGGGGGSINCHTRNNCLLYVLKADLHVLRISGLTMAVPPTPDTNNESYSAHTHTI
jgi:hypothetical protein